MGKSRAPEVNEDGLAAYLAAPDLKLRGLRNRFAQLDELTQAKKIPASYIAIEGMAALLGARIEGYTDDKLRACWPTSWGNGEITVPATLLIELSAAWIKYKEDVPGRTFGEVLDLEGGGQGKKRAVSAQITRDKHRQLANEVILIYVTLDENGERSTLATAIEEVATNHGISFETVQTAYKDYGPATLEELKRQGI